MADSRDDDERVGHSDPKALRKRLLTATATILAGLDTFETAVNSSSPPEWESVNELEAHFDAFIRDARMLHLRLTGHHLQGGILKRED